MSNPYVGVTVQTDVTELAAFCKENRFSFYLMFMHAAALAANSIPEFRQRICPEGIVEYEECGTSHTESTENGAYCYCTLKHDMPFLAYIGYAERERQAARARAGFAEDAEADSLYFISSLPWLHYTQLIQPTDGCTQTNPRITWGKHERDAQGRRMMPVTVLCHHALVDGSHLAAFYERLQVQMKEIVQSVRP